MENKDICKIKEKVESKIDTMLIEEMEKHILNICDYEVNYDFLDKGLSDDKIDFYEKELEKVLNIIDSIYSGFQQDIPKEINKLLENYIKKRDKYISLINKNKLVVFINPIDLEMFKSLFKITKKTHFIKWDRSDIFYTYSDNIVILTDAKDTNATPVMENILKYKIGVSIFFESEIFKINIYK